MEPPQTMTWTTTIDDINHHKSPQITINHHKFTMTWITTNHHKPWHKAPWTMTETSTKHDMDRYKSPQTMTWTIMMTQKDKAKWLPCWHILHKIYTGLHFMRVKMRAWTTRLAQTPTIPCPQGNFRWPKFGPPPPIQIIPASTITSPTLNIVRNNADKHSCLFQLVRHFYPSYVSFLHSSETESDENEIEWSDEELSDGDTSWAQLARQYKRIQKQEVRKAERAARRAARAAALGEQMGDEESSTDSETACESDDDWETESETEKESEGEGRFRFKHRNF